MKIFLSINAQKEFRKLDVSARKRIKTKLEWYFSHEDPLVFADTLNDSCMGAYRYRIGDYRVLFDVVSDAIRVNCIGHRREIYR